MSKPSMPKWYKRAGPLLPVNSVNECDIVAYDGRLILAAFNRPPMTQQVKFYDISDVEGTPILLAARAWAGAMGGMCVDDSGGLHIYGSSPPAQNSPPYNSIIHSAVDANWNLSAPNTIIGPSGMGFNNITVARTPLGYVMRLEQAYSNGNKAESGCSSPDPSFSSYTALGAMYNPPDFTGKSRIRAMPDGWIYVTSDAAGRTRIARTQNFSTWKFADESPFSFMGPDFGDVPASDSRVFYDGNVSWEEWPIGGVPHVVAVYFQANETTEGRLMLAKYQGTLASLFAEFTYQP